MDISRRRSPRIVVVGPCASGKTTLVTALRSRGYDAHVVAQEHSDVPHLWGRHEPDLVIALTASLQVVRQRRGAGWLEAVYERQQHRLADVMVHASLVVDTGEHSAEEVVTLVVEAIESWRRNSV